MGRTYTPAHAGALAAQLPRESRTVRAIDPEAEWGWAETILSACEYWLHVLVWAQTKDGQHGRNKPEQITPPKRGETAADAARKAAQRRHVDEVLGKR